MLISCSDVDLHACQGEDSGQNTPDSVVEWEADDVTDHGEFSELPVALDGLVSACEIEHYKESDGRRGTSNDGDVLQR